MTGLYVFALLAGGPLLLWFAFAGDADSDGFGGDADGDGLSSVIPLSSVAFVLAFFGLTGLLGQATGAGAFAVLLVAAVVAVIAGTINSLAFRFVKGTGASSDVTNAELEGKIASVTLPISTDHRGKIAVTKAGAREQMTAASVDGSDIDRGDRVVIVRVEGGVAQVAHLGPELELD